MIIVGLTGSIGMGKSVAAAMFRRMGIPVHDSDAAVHRLLGPRGKAVEKVLRSFPGTGTADTGIDRAALGREVFSDKSRLKRLEAILHPLVIQSQQDFLRRQRARRHKIVVLDIPLLFETEGDKRVDYIIVVTAPSFIQQSRVLRRGLDMQQFQMRLASQMHDVEKRRRADFIVHTGHGMAYTRNRLKAIIRELKGS